MCSARISSVPPTVWIAAAGTSYSFSLTLSLRSHNSKNKLSPAATFVTFTQSIIASSTSLSNTGVQPKLNTMQLPGQRQCVTWKPLSGTALTVFPLLTFRGEHHFVGYLHSLIPLQICKSSCALHQHLRQRTVRCTSGMGEQKIPWTSCAAARKDP